MISFLLFHPFQISEVVEGRKFNNSIHVISAMPAYQDKSFEEIRLEDYTGAAGFFSLLLISLM
jgi:hypothetical protein